LLVRALHEKLGKIYSLSRVACPEVLQRPIHLLIRLLNYIGKRSKDSGTRHFAPSNAVSLTNFLLIKNLDYLYILEMCYFSAKIPQFSGKKSPNF
jgi:hypothetical protein